MLPEDQSEQSACQSGVEGMPWEPHGRHTILRSDSSLISEEVQHLASRNLNIHQDSFLRSQGPSAKHDSPTSPKLPPPLPRPSPSHSPTCEASRKMPGMRSSGARFSTSRLRHRAGRRSEARRCAFPSPTCHEQSWLLLS